MSQVRSLLGEPSPRYLSMLNLGYLLARMTTCVYGVQMGLGFRGSRVVALTARGKLISQLFPASMYSMVGYIF